MLVINVIILQASEVAQVGSDVQSQIANTELADGEVGVDCFCIAVGKKVPPNSAVPLGQYILYWKRSVKIEQIL